ncbi:unnamed protein product [Mytilus coruscus]|uniref:Uncharacterized protein n=1 Tax=Mytilus coruscus TaxID=42192 RepID=A0A6J8CX26_MYTCO|nr:unnamed protein product [Mytilus coruscus]
MIGVFGSELFDSSEMSFYGLFTERDDNISSLVKLREEGSQGINKASREREDQILASAGQFVHQECRKLYTKLTEITKSKRQQNTLKESVTNIQNLRSKSHFSYKDHCLFCGKEAQKCKLKGNDVFPVRTDDFQRRIEQNICGKISVVTLKDTASCVLQEFYQRPTYQKPDDEKKAIIEAATKLIKSDIRSLKGDKENYPLASDVSSLKSNLEYVPESLRYLLEAMFAEKDSKMKIASIGQAIIQASRPRVLIAPLQIGLSIQLHNNFASRFLVST